MRISVLIEPVPGKGYRARCGERLGLIAEGETRDEALQKLRELIDERVAGGAELVAIDLPEQKPAHAWLPYAGMIQDDPLVEEWKQTMAEYRRQVDLADSEQMKP
jgi:predicted RNase H-like HicB family nuclease